MKKGLSMLAVTMIGAALAAPAYAQTASSSAASPQGETPELRVAAIILHRSLWNERHPDRIQHRALERDCRSAEGKDELSDRA